MFKIKLKAINNYVMSSGEFMETKRYRSASGLHDNMQNHIEELLKDPEIVMEAIKSRNAEIRRLEAIIKHMKLTFDETESRHDEIADKNEVLTEELRVASDTLKIKLDENIELQKKIKTQESKLMKLTGVIELDQKIKNNTFVYKIERLSAKMGGWKGATLRVCLTPPVLTYVIIGLWLLTFAASIFGWDVVLSSIKPFIELFK